MYTVIFFKNGGDLGSVPGFRYSDSANNFAERTLLMIEADGFALCRKRAVFGRQPMGKLS
jgi:hypothetical protein